MPAPATDRLPANPHRTRDLILLVCSLVAGVLAVIYRHQGFDLGLVLLSVALFWLAVLDSARSGPRRAPLLVFAASAVLIGIGVIVIVAAVLVMMRPAATPRTLATPPAPAVPLAPVRPSTP